MAALRISEGANLAIHGMAFLASRPDAPQSAADMAARMGVSRHHLGKVLQRLARVGLLTSRRGPHGGFVLPRPPQEIRLIEIVEAIDGPLEHRGCLLGAPICDPERCALADLTGELTDRLQSFFAKTTLADLPRID